MLGLTTRGWRLIPQAIRFQRAFHWGCSITLTRTFASASSAPRIISTRYAAHQWRLRSLLHLPVQLLRVVVSFLALRFAIRPLLGYVPGSWYAEVLCSSEWIDIGTFWPKISTLMVICNFGTLQPSSRLFCCLICLVWWCMVMLCASGGHGLLKRWDNVPLCFLKFLLIPLQKMHGFPSQKWQ